MVGICGGKQGRSVQQGGRSESRERSCGLLLRGGGPEQRARVEDATVRSSGACEGVVRARRREVREGPGLARTKIGAW